MIPSKSVPAAADTNASNADAPSAAGSRILCAEVPLFSLAARLRSEPELVDEAVAILAGQGAAARVIAASRRARRLGIRPGFTLSQARARLPKLIARPRDAECERAAQEALLDVAEGFSPRVEDAGEGLVYLDGDGLDRHYSGDDPEGDLGRALALALEQQANLPARIGMAASKLAAQMAARRGPSPAIIPAGQEASFLAGLSLECVSPQASTLATLQQWGINSLGDFARLPEAEVISRLGSAGSELQARARGEDSRPLVPRVPPPAFREGTELEWPLVNLEPFLFVARAALERVLGRMQSQGLGCCRLEVSLQLEPDGHHERAIQLPASTRDLKTLLTLLRLDLESAPPGAAIVAFTLTAHPDRPRQAQLSLFGPEALSPDKLATTLARLFSILGDDRVGSPRTTDGHRPERFSLVPYKPPPPPKEHAAPASGRGLLSVRVLRPALEVEVMIDNAKPPSEPLNNDQRTTDHAERPSLARPISLKTPATDEASKKPKIYGTIKVASGPWSLEEAWWCDEPTERDYWDIELAGGALYRLYRQRTTGDWFIDGIYD